MAGPIKVDEAAPAYEELFNNHPTSQQSSSAYATVPQVDIDDDYGHHGCDEESHPLQPSNSIDPEKPHAHCEVCDRRLEKREKREAAQQCCSMVAGVFVVAIVCSMLLGIVIAKAAAVAKSNED